MGTPAIGSENSVIKINVFFGTRQPIPSGTSLLFTVVNGNQQVVYRNFQTTSSLTLTGLPYFDNFGDNYSVVVAATGYAQAGFYPVRVSPQAPAVIDLMLLRNNADFNFNDARWDLLRQNHPEYAALLTAGVDDNAAAQDRYTQLMENRPAVLACFFNLVTAMSQIHLPSGTPLDYIPELIWDDTMQQDRFFAWADPNLVHQVAQAAAQGGFSAEPGTALFHKGATRSWKQVQFGEANVQLTFHENDKKTIDGVECVMIEPDIDYYRDIAAHALLEVITNAVTHSLTDPRQVYVLRWMAGRHAGVPNFEPPYFLD
jgi:hypothetical protein